MTSVIRTRALTKRYGKRRGIDNVAFDVSAGEVFGFLGPNGAGKSTTIRLLMGLLRATGGEASVFGLDPFREAARVHARVGYLAGEMGMAERMRAADHVEFLANLHGSARDVEDLEGRLDLDLSAPLRQMSRGNKQKVGLLEAFMARPELLILDEPTTGLDPLMQQVFHELVAQVRKERRTVFLSSHVLSEVEALCDRVAIIREGRIVAVETIVDLKRRAVRHARIRFSKPVGPKALEGVPGVSGVQTERGALVCSVEGAAGPLIRRLAELPVEDVQLRETSLDDIFRAYYEAPRRRN